MNTQDKWVTKAFTFNKTIDDFNSLILSLNQNAIFIKQLTEAREDVLRSKSLVNNWSIKENVGHLIDLEELHDKSLDQFLANEKVLTPADMSNLKTSNAEHNKKPISALKAKLLEC